MRGILGYFAVVSGVPLVLAQSYSKNVSSSSSQLSYTGSWHSDQRTGVYEAYSNDTAAAATFSFLGIGATYLGYRKFDRGVCTLTLDDTVGYTIDMFSDAATSPEVFIWTSPLLPYGNHTVTLAQNGIDPRLGVYPFLVSETWIEVIPTNITAYVATEATTTASPTLISPTTTPVYQPGSPGIAPIVGGAVGGVIAIILVSFLYLLWRRDRAQTEQSQMEKRQRKNHRMMMAQERGSEEDDRHMIGSRYTMSGTTRGASQESEREQSIRHDREREELRTASRYSYRPPSLPRQTSNASRDSRFSKPPSSYLASSPLSGSGSTNVSALVPQISTRLSSTSSYNSSIPSPSSYQSQPPSHHSTYPSTSHHYSGGGGSNQPVSTLVPLNHYRSDSFNRETLSSPPEMREMRLDGGMISRVNSSSSSRGGATERRHEAMMVELQHPNRAAYQEYSYPHRGTVSLPGHASRQDGRERDSERDRARDRSRDRERDRERDRVRDEARDRDADSNFTGLSNSGHDRSRSGSYPYHTQGFGEERRAFPVPEV